MRPVFWNDARINEMRRLADEGKNAMDIAHLFDVTVLALRWQARHHKIQIGGRNAHFLPREDRVIRDMAHLGWIAVAEELGRSRETVTRRAGVLGIKSGKARNWSEAEDTTLKSLLNIGMSQGEISGKINRSINAISARCKRLSVSKARLARDNIAPIVKAKPAKRIKRKCLACGNDFPSSWIGNRRCKPCTSSSQYQTSGSQMI